MAVGHSPVRRKDGLVFAFDHLFSESLGFRLIRGHAPNNPPLALGEMVDEQLLRTINVAGAQRPHEGDVNGSHARGTLFWRIRIEVPESTIHDEKHARLDPQTTPRLLQQQVVAEIKSDVVKTQVTIHTPSLGFRRATRIGPQFVEHRIEPLHGIVIQCGRRQTQRGNFEVCAKAEHLARKLGCELRDESSAARNRYNEAKIFELVKGLAHGSIARPHLGRDLRLDDALAGLELTKQDSLFERERNLLAEARDWRRRKALEIQFVHSVLMILGYP